jgi:formimidoylglutamate deiminase
MSTRWLLPELAWTPAGLLRGAAVGIEGDQIVDVRAADAVPAEATRTPLARRLLLPGFVNVHSHAFQRAFRAQTEFLRAGREHEDFWSWRQQMYAHALSHSPESVYASARRLYEELRAGGFTSVGEFHYLHHAPDGSPYAPPTRLADAVIQAAVDAGLRICALMTLYHTGDVGRPALPEQRRFLWPAVTPWLEAVEAVQARWRAEPLVSVGLAPHSIRAVPVAWLREIADWNQRAGLPVHMHVCEQPAEVRASVAALGMAPIQVIENTGLLNERFTGVHGTWLEPEDAARLGRAGARICACPSTEANLGDGFLPARALLEAGVRLCVGTDSHILTSPLEELRLIENHERLQRGRRNVLAPWLHRAAVEAPPGTWREEAPEGLLRAAPGLLEIGAGNGADALGLRAGRIEAGALADLVAVDLDDLALRDVAAPWLPEALVFSAGPRCVREVFVGGKLSAGAEPGT